MAEEKSKKTSKKKVSKKKISKKKVSKKVTKKVSRKKVVPKKAAKKVLRKKASDKKPIKLKADSPELDSFAEHAAENIAAIEEAAVSLESAPPTTVKQETQPEPVVMEKKQSVTVSESISEDKPKPKIDVDAYYKKPTPAADDESFRGKLIVAAVLFLGVGIYTYSIFQQQPQSSVSDKTTTAAVVDSVDTSKAESKATTVASGSQIVITADKAETSVPVAKEMVEKPRYTVSAPVDSTTGVSGKAEKTQTESLAEHMEAVAKQVETPAVIKTVQAPAPVMEAPKYPPPPTPEFLRGGASKPLPQAQMDMIKQTFAPELFN